MKNNYNYRITLTPVDKFFFGGDMTFQVGNDEEDKFNTQYSSYIIQSARIPQQTSLLGMLRFLILRNAGEEVFKDNRIVDSEKANKLIGDKSFTVNESHSTNIFGKIKDISHVRICRDDTELEFAPLFGQINFSECSKGSYNLGYVSVPNLSNEQYNAKDGLETLLMASSGFNDYFKKYQIIKKARMGEKKDQPNLQTSPYQLDDLFVEDRRIGISRNIRTGKTEDGALFKQISYRFNDKEAKHCFVFDAEVTDVALKSYNGHLVTVGGDNSQFIIGISDFVSKPDAATSALAVSLLSPAFLTREDVKGNTKFAITRLMPFRFLTDRKDNSEKDNRSYHILNSKLERSPRYELYAPGSVFYFENEDQKQNFIKAIESKKEFRQIGYNEYI